MVAEVIAEVALDDLANQSVQQAFSQPNAADVAQFEQAVSGETFTDSVVDKVSDFKSRLDARMESVGELLKSSDASDPAVMVQVQWEVAMWAIEATMAHAVTTKSTQSFDTLLKTQ